MNILTIITYVLSDCMGYVITYDSCEGRYINMSKAKALAQFREDFGLKGKRLERL